MGVVIFNCINFYEKNCFVYEKIIFIVEILGFLLLNDSWQLNRFKIDLMVIFLFNKYFKVM